MEKSEKIQLIEYYKERIENFDVERHEWIQKLEDLRYKQDEKHKKEWELRKRYLQVFRNNEVTQLQNALTETKVLLYEERRQLLNKIRQNDSLVRKEIQDTQKIKELMILTGTVEEKIVLQKDTRPKTITNFVQNDLNLNHNKQNQQLALKMMGNTQKNVPVANGSGKSVLKTIYLPNELQDSVSIENAQLKNQLEQLLNAYEQELNGIREELRIKNEELALKTEVDGENMDNQQKKIQQLEKTILEINREYFALRVEKDQNEKKMMEKMELIQLKNEALENKLAILNKKFEIEIQSQKELIEQKSSETLSKIQKTVNQKEENLLLIKDQYNKVQSIYLEKMKLLEHQLTDLADKYTKLDKVKIKTQRRRLELEGYKLEIRNLKEKTFQQKQINLNIQEDAKKTQEIKKYRKPQPEPPVQDDEESVNLSELENIKRQLIELEHQLDCAS